MAVSALKHLLRYYLLTSLDGTLNRDQKQLNSLHKSDSVSQFRALREGWEGLRRAPCSRS